MLKKNLFFFAIFLSIFVFLSGYNSLSAEILDPDTVIKKRAELEAELADIERQIDAQNSIIKEKQRESTTLERDIAIFESKIEKSRLEIKARDLAIKKLGNSIKEKEGVIGILSSKIDREKESLGELLRRTNEIDSTSLIEVILGYEDMSDFFNDLDTFGFIEEAVQDSFNELRNDVTKTQAEKEELVSARTEQYELKSIQELQEKKNQEYKKEKEQILKITKGEEKKYQEILKEKQKSAAEIKSALFVLRGSDAIPFEKALLYANNVFRETGVRPAFLLGIITEESNLGANVGSGNWKDDLYDCYIRIGYKTSAEKQKTAFMEITSELRLNPDILPVSKAPYYGCGGAMGPAQFMPTTWSLYKDLIAKKTGNNPPSPWNPEDAFMASGLLLKDNGAAAGGYEAERRAALRYLAGGNWQKPAYAFYGDDVMEIAAKYQSQINILGL
ncbi:MAG: lytic murein transglycosylase [Parcubacteria group bacterium]|nr:lytic murein transglycosylase [Parcubacteria group bacterium]MCR4342626.1 lytic murein transglycosylase [Patescibacteria group bacterium]